MQDIIVKKKFEDGEEAVKINEPNYDGNAEQTEHHDPNVLEWTAEEYIFKEKTNDWYWTVGAVTVGLIILSYFLKNFLFAMISIIGGFSVALLGAKKPGTLTFRITERGIQAADKIHLFKDIDSFCINEELEGRPRLFAKMRSGFLSVAVFPIHPEDIETIKEFLKKYIKEQETEESFTSIFIRLIGV